MFHRVCLIISTTHWLRLSGCISWLFSRLLLIVGQNMRDIWLSLEVGYNKHFMVEYCSRDVSDHESK